MMSGARLVAGFGLVLSLMLPVRAVAGPTLLFEPATGRVLYAEEMDDQWHPASLTKMMTAYLTFQAIKAGKIKLDTPITYSEAAHKMPPSKIGLPVGATLQVDIALQSVIVKSANDIALALAEAVGGSEEAFVEQMNQTARRLGMTRTVFRNPHGLHAPEQVSTARDLARLAVAVVRDFPEHAHYWAQSQMQFGQIQITSHNGLFKTLPGADGIKTGFICDSGYNMVASATRDGVRLMAVVLGERTAAERNQRAAELLEHGYVTREWKALFGARQTVASLPLSPEAKDAASIRNSIISIECTNRRMARVAAAAKRAKARNAKAAAKRQPAQQQGGAPGAPTPAAAAKAKATATARTAAPASAAAPAAK